MAEDSKPPPLPALFVPVPEWIVVAGLSPQALALYTVLLAHVNRQRGDQRAWPSLSTLAELLGYNRPHSVLPYLTELSEIGAVTVTTVTCPTGRRNEYTVRTGPPPAYEGPRAIAQYHAERRRPIGGSDATASDGSVGTASDGSDATPSQNQTKTTRRTKPDEPTSSDAYAAGAPRASSRGDTDPPNRIRIYPPKDLDTMPSEQACRRLIACADRAMAKAGYRLSDEAKSGLGRALLAADEEDRREHLAERLENTLNMAVAGVGDFAWIVHGRAA